jgi:hypothetical protein
LFLGIGFVRCRGGCANRLSTGPWHKGLYNPSSAQKPLQPESLKEPTIVPGGDIGTRHVRCAEGCFVSVQICEICGQTFDLKLSINSRAP